MYVRMYSAKIKQSNQLYKIPKEYKQRTNTMSFNVMDIKSARTSNNT